VEKSGLGLRNVMDADSRRTCRAFYGLLVETEYSDPLFTWLYLLAYESLSMTAIEDGSSAEVVSLLAGHLE
jgi:hypothetical protein